MAMVGYFNVATATNQEAKDAYYAAADKAAADYRDARLKCDVLNGNAQDVCVEQAKAAQTRAKGEAEALYLNTRKARQKARTDIANADFAVAKAMCGSKTGKDKDACIKQANAVQEHALADAKADRKVSLEKCEATDGASKDKCVATVKSK
jgi:hypothetical protein